VAGKGLAILRAAGVEVTEHILEGPCTQLNDVFFHFIQTQTPYVVLKYAMTLDGKLAAYTGASQWITGEAARQHVHTLRGRYRAIMVGVETVITDDPRLTCRLEGGRNPLRVICDSRLRTPLGAKVVRTAGEIPTLIATCSNNLQRIGRYTDQGVQVVTLPDRDGRVDLKELMRYLGQQQVDSVLLEGGASLHWAALDSGIVHKVMAYVSPMLLGGGGAPSPVGGQGFPHPDQAIRLKEPVLTRLGSDYLFESEVAR